MSTLLITNGLIYDGLGGKPYPGDILIDGDRIVQITARINASTEYAISPSSEYAISPSSGHAIDVQADRVIDAKGMAVTPGFIDIHRHCDIKPLTGERFGDALLTQGITTTVVGNCGISLLPRSPDPDQARAMYDVYEPVLGPVSDLLLQNGPATYEDYLLALDKSHLPVNFASMVGTGSVRIAVKGFDASPYTKEEMKAAQKLIESALTAGAAGISTGLMYVPECYSSKEEMVELLAPAGACGAALIAHIRGEGDSLVASVREIIAIGKEAGCPVEISHFKSCGIKNWRKSIHEAIAVIAQARASGQDVTCDFYPYDGGSTALTTMIPPAYIDAFARGDMKKAVASLGTAEGNVAFRNYCAREYADWDNYAISLGWDRTIVSAVVWPHNQRFVGKSIQQAAEEFGFADAASCAAWLMHDEEGKTAIISMSMCQYDVDTVAQLPFSSVISDSIYAKTDSPHPRLYGAFPKIIRDMVLERNLMTLPEAIRKMTDMPARRLKLADRGRLAEHCFADINIFDPTVFRDHATYANPAQLSTGLSYCLVNGQLALVDGIPSRGSFGTNLRVRHFD